jgi:hypothetical protein
MTRLSSGSDPTANLVAVLAWARVTPPETEVRFHPTRRWRFDLAWPSMRLAVEVEGGTWAGGRHTRGAGFEADCEKYNEAALAHWTVLRVTPAMIDDGRALAVIERGIRVKLSTHTIGGDEHYRTGAVPERGAKP